MYYFANNHKVHHFDKKTKVISSQLTVKNIQLTLIYDKEQH